MYHGYGGKAKVRSYSRVEHLATSLLLGKNLKQSLMAMITSYSDASGTVDSEHSLVISGFVSTADRWKTFEKKWIAELKTFEVPYFHMTDFAHSIGVFASWKENESRREAFIKRLVSICLSNTLFSFSTAILLSDYHDVNLQYRYRERTRGPYAMCGRNYIAKVQTWHKKSRYSAMPLDFIFEDGDKGKGKLVEHLEQYGYPIPSFKPKFPDKGTPNGELVPLQAADLIAWEHNKFIVTKVKSQNEIPAMRKSLARLAKRPHLWEVITKKQMLNGCVKFDIPER